MDLEKKLVLEDAFVRENKYLEDLLIFSETRKNFEAHRIKCVAACDRLAVIVEDALELSRSEYVFKRHAMTYFAGTSGGSNASYLAPDVHLTVYLQPREWSSFRKAANGLYDDQVLSEGFTQALRDAISKSEHISACYSGFRDTEIMAEIDRVAVHVEAAMYLDPRTGGSVDKLLWESTLKYSKSVEETEKDLDKSNSRKMFIARSGAVQLAKYLREEGYFVKKVVMLLKLWAVHNLRGSERRRSSLNIFVELVAVHCGENEVRRGKELDVDPSLMKALVQCWRELSKDVAEVKIWANDYLVPMSSSFRYLTFPLDSAKEKLRCQIATKTSMLLDPVNPYVNYLDDTETWKLIQQRAQRSLDLLVDAKRKTQSVWLEEQAMAKRLCKRLLYGEKKPVVLQLLDRLQTSDQAQNLSNLAKKLGSHFPAKK